MFKVQSRFWSRLYGSLISAPFVVSAFCCAASEEVSAADSGMGAVTDIALVPNGALTDAGWALARLNNAANVSNLSFAYPETTNPVRLYLIDSAVSHVDSWFTQNPNLKSFESHVIRSAEDPSGSSAFAHGTKLLSLIAGPETGGALGTPLHIVNYDVYPNGDEGGTTSGLLTSALNAARIHHISHPGMPGVVCISSGSNTPATSPSLRASVDAAVASGLTVVVSAGNLGLDASSFIPASYGISSGVICVGASNSQNGPWPSSNFGDPVDIFAPGENVRVLNIDAPQLGSYGSMSGTSPASALAAAAAIIEVSKNPALTPAEVEAKLVAGAFQSQPKALVQVTPDPEVDSDLDGTTDSLETFFGSNPADPGATPDPLIMTKLTGEAQLGFSISADLFVAETPYQLSDGRSWKVRCSENLTDWTDVEGSLAVGEMNGTKIPVTFTLSTFSDSCFLQIEVLEAP